ncbi:MAG TPA: ABC transporter substrate-binding protein [Actinomycetota bacterium]|nr:ABC transporter substrate-binding protein [Actinomycetota bacterium]
MRFELSWIKTLLSRIARPAILVVSCLVLVAGMFAACGGDDDDGGDVAEAGSEEGEPVSLDVGVIPIADVAPLYLGIEEGFFEEENLTINPQPAEGGAIITPEVISGDLQIGYSNTVSLLIAASQDLPVKIISQGVIAGRDESEAWADLLVLKDGPIKEPSDLEGKAIAVNTLNSICEVTIKASLEDMGVDVSTLKFAEVPFVDMNAALEAGRVEGACAVEPFVTAGKAANAVGIDPFFVNTAPDLTVATYFTTRQYAEENADVVERFVRAIHRSLDFAEQNPDKVRKILPTYTEIPDAVAQQITLPAWRSDLNEDTIELTAELAVKYGLIEEAPNLEELLLSPTG